ncbi:MAG: hypothetical protein MUE48_05905 [Desulfobacterales bacterium]|nr:hypothetical protein [Desulfobacterales bacterium]
MAFGDGDYRQTVNRLRPVRSLAARFGGSHAQRDAIDLTLIEAALRAKDAGQSSLHRSDRGTEPHRAAGTINRALHEVGPKAR